MCMLSFGIDVCVSVCADMGILRLEGHQNSFGAKKKNITLRKWMYVEAVGI